MTRVLLDTIRHLLLFALLACPATAQDADCSNDEELVQSTDMDLSSALPCTSLGAYFLVGLGISNDHFASFAFIPRESEISFPYYAPTRLYLAYEARGFEDGFHEAFPALLSASAMIVADQMPSADVRRRIYSTFLIGEYWDHTSPSGATPREFLAEGMIALMRGVPLRNHTEVRCFVRSDIPTRAVDEIVQSARYEACLRNIDSDSD